MKPGQSRALRRVRSEESRVSWMPGPGQDSLVSARLYGLWADRGRYRTPEPSVVTQVLRDTPAQLPSV